MIELRPYGHYDGIPTFRDSDIKGFYDRMVSDGTAGIVFYDGSVKSADDFLKVMKSPGTYLYACYKDNVLMGVSWLNRVKSKTAYFHFCGFSSSWGDDAAGIARDGIKILMGQKDQNGEYLLNVFIGLVPSFNQRAIDFLVECGGTHVGNIPFAIWNHKKQRSEPGALIYYIREADCENL